MWHAILSCAMAFSYDTSTSCVALNSVILCMSNTHKVWLCCNKAQRNSGKTANFHSPLGRNNVMHDSKWWLICNTILFISKEECQWERMDSQGQGHNSDWEQLVKRKIFIVIICIWPCPIKNPQAARVKFINILSKFFCFLKYMS